MKSTALRFAGLALLSVAAVGCSTKAPGNGDPGPSRAYSQARNLPSTGVALEGYCPVAYFAADRPVMGSSDFTADHDGVTYWFVNEEAREAFEQEPDRYVPAYGGWCAFGMSVEDKFPVDPRSFKIVDGRLMLFLRNPSVDARQLWNGGSEAELIGKANAHWRKVQG